MLELGVNHVQLDGERREDHDQGRKHDQADNQQRQQRCDAVAFPDPAAQFVFHRMENHGQD
ncbi:hypothetical protein D3C72_704670 [compost metagenome]